MASDDWLTLFEHAEHKMSMLLELGTKKQQLDAAGNNAARVKRDIRKHLDVLKDTLGKLDSSLVKPDKDNQFSSKTSELTRRKNLMNSLRIRIEKFRNEYNEKQQQKQNRAALIDRTQPQHSGKEDINSLAMSDQDILQQQIQEFDAHDEKLDGILHGVGRLKDMGRDINTELLLHQELIEDLEQGMDDTSLNLRDSTRKADNLAVNQKGCTATIVIVVLLAAIVVLSVVPS